jgi:hypothetical protein
VSSYDVKFWEPRRIGDTTKGRWWVRWEVAGREHCKSFAARPLADGFLTRLKNAARDHLPFDQATGLPITLARDTDAPPRTWYDHARAYAEMKWPQLAPKSRRSTAEALTTITLALTTHRKGAPDPKTLSRALFKWAFNPGTRALTRPTTSPKRWTGPPP